MIRIRMGRVPDSILRTNISRVAFDPVAQYNNLIAIFAVEGAPEVQFAMDTLGMRVPIRILDIPIIPPLENLPHLPPILASMTMDQALDEVARTFHSIVLYGVCSNSKLYEISFAGGYNYPESWFEH